MASLPRSFKVELGVVAVLACTVAITWCMAFDKWTVSQWQQPLAYIENAEKSDVIYTFATLKAGARGQFIPFVWKSVPELGAPNGANWNDWPIIEEFQLAFFGWLARLFGVFAGLNVAMLLGNVLAAMSMYAVARICDCSRLWSFVAGFAFGLAPFIFAQSPHHITCEWVWQVPLFLLVWRWVFTEHGIAWRSPRFWQAIAIGFLSGLQNPYFTNILCQLTLIGGAIQYLRTKSRSALASAAAVVVAAAIAFALMSVDTWTYRAVHGSNPGALVREYKWLEIYGLKIKDLFIPPVTHHSQSLAAFSTAHRQVAPLLDEGASYQGLVGLACLLWLVITSVRAMIDRRERDVPMEVWWVLWIVLMFTTGGLNAIVGAFGFTIFRGGCRYSIVILAITLLWAARRITSFEQAIDSQSDVQHRGAHRMLFRVVAGMLCLLIVWDQVPRTPSAEESTTIARLVDADRAFTEKMEAALPEGAMVFQLPIMDYPESPAPGVPPYDHFRPYLYSKSLRYSFGSMKGRPAEAWQKELERLPSLEQIIAELKKRGFAAIYINRNGFPDRAKGIEDKLLEMGYIKPPIRNATGDLSCVILDGDGGRPGSDTP